MLLTFDCEYTAAADPKLGKPNGPLRLRIEMKMSESQALDAMSKILANISDEAFAEWARQNAPHFLKATA